MDTQGKDIRTILFGHSEEHRHTYRQTHQVQKASAEARRTRE